MCLIGIAKDAHPDYPFMLWANRDEFYHRPAKELHKQPLNETFMLAGKDLEAGGTWLGIRPDGEIAAVTNVRGMVHNPNARTRGEIIPFLLKREEAVQDIYNEKDQFNGFNLIYGSVDGELSLITNQSEAGKTIRSGVFAFSNGALTDQWPKTAFLEDRIKHSFALKGPRLIEYAFNSLGNRQPAADDELPNTGVGYSLEKMLSPVYITGNRYGTRCSSIILLDQFGRITFIERTYYPLFKQVGYDFPMIEKGISGQTATN
ncbi:NRDE family protein [Salisediminibacterium halotolerans]|uniref:Uncharacterized conserved protein, contains NRDE domain n=1 Tax=Salisediminibacterium halotolerans TaxID=517425 RepID=A0A1H9NX91_9BACI|nr:NRDE family protein [Salisediminibacterium haloalkalitolerans]SER40548.1 Uncharacterized conserved protein, contains NRDE domain [Salisediminibacterium haloalkalitolerans]